MASILISGWYGFGNLGDEAILAAIAGTITRDIPGTRIQVLSRNPAFTAGFQGLDAVRHLPAGITAWCAAALSGKLFKTLCAFFSCDLILIGGGGFLSDWQPEAPWIWLRQALLGRLLGKKVILYGIGAGPFTRPFGKWLTRTIVNRCVQSVTVRDEKSKQWLLTAGVKDELIAVTADPAIRYPLPNQSEKTGPPRTVGICVAPIFHSEKYWPGKHEKYLRYISAMSQIVNGLIDGGFEVLFIPMQESLDLEFAESILEGVHNQVKVLSMPQEIDQAVTQLNQVDILVTMRLHAAVLGALQGIPIAGIIYHHKVAEFIDRIDMREFAAELGDGSNWREADIDPLHMLANIKAIADDYDAVRSRMRREILSLQDQEKGNISRLKCVLAGNNP